MIPALPSYFVQPADPSNGSDLPSVVHESQVSLRGGVKLSDFNVTESLEEFPPYVRPESVPDGQAHAVLLISLALGNTNVQITSLERTLCDHTD